MANSQELEDLLNQYKSFMGPPAELQGSEDNDLETQLDREPATAPIIGQQRANQLIAATEENPAPPNQMEPEIDEDQKILEASPEWTGNPAEIDFTNPMKTLMAYQAARRPAQSNLNYLSAGNKAGQGISRLFGATIDDNDKGISRLDKQLDTPINEYEKLLKLHKEGSLASRASGFGLFTNNVGEPLEKNNVTGQLWNVLKNRPHDPAEGIVVRGVPKLFTGDGGEVYERLPGRPQTPTAISGPEGMIRKGVGAKLEGDVEPPSNSPEVVSPEAGDAVPAKKSEKAFQPTREQKSALDDETKRLDGLTKDINAKIDAVSRLSQTLASNSKLTGAMVKTQFPRLAGEVGNLNQQEQEVWQGSSALLDRLNQYVSTLSDSTLTNSNKKELKKLIDIFSNTSNSAMGSIMSSSANRLKMVRNIPEDFTLQSYGQLRAPLKGKVKLGPDEKVTDHNGKKLIWNTKTNKAVRWLKDNEQ